MTKIINAPGLKPRSPAADGTVVYRWRAREDLVERGYTPKNVIILRARPEELTEAQVKHIQDQCQALQDAMLGFARGGLPNHEVIDQSDGTLGGLIWQYMTDPESQFTRIRHKTQVIYTGRCRRIKKDHGDIKLADIRARTLRRWYEDWKATSGHATANALITMLRTLLTFGTNYLEDPECTRIKEVLSEERFEQARSRRIKHWLTAQQAEAVRAMAHQMGRPSIALAMAFQFELLLRPKDAIGEYVPASADTKDFPYIVYGTKKWVYGLRWEEIDSDLKISHITSKRQKELEVSLRKAPMVMEELSRLGTLPASGPVIVCEDTGMPWVERTYTRWWRKIATAAGLPKTTWNMDARAGGVTEATTGGAIIEHVQQAATHSSPKTTQGYSRGQFEKIESVQDIRIAHRNKLKITP